MFSSQKVLENSPSSILINFFPPSAPSTSAFKTVIEFNYFCKQESLRPLYAGEKGKDGVEIGLKNYRIDLGGFRKRSS